MKETHGFIYDTAKYLPAQIAPGLVGVISIPIVTRLFPPQDYGDYNLVMAIVAVFSLLGGWIASSIVRFFPSYKKRNELEHFSTNAVKLALISVVIISLFFSILLVVLKPLLSESLFNLTLLGLLVVVFAALFNAMLGLLRAKRKVVSYSAFFVYRATVAFGIGLVLIFLFGFNISGLLWGLVISTAIILPLLWKYSIGHAINLRIKLDVRLAKEMARYSFPIVAGNIAAWALSLSDRFILKIFRGSLEVGIYSASYNISDRSIMLVASLFMLASDPILMHIFEHDGISRAKEFITTVTKYYLIVCVPLVVGISLLSKPLVRIMTGEQYYTGYRIFPFVLAGVLLLGLQKRFNDGLLIKKKTQYIAVAIVSAGLLNVLLNFVFIPKYGFFAAAITTLISYVFLLFLMILFSRRFIVWSFPAKSFFHVLIATAIMGVVVYFLSSGFAISDIASVIISSFIGAATYSLVLFLLGEFSLSDIGSFVNLKLKNNNRL